MLGKTGGIGIKTGIVFPRQPLPANAGNGLQYADADPLDETRLEDGDAQGTDLITASDRWHPK